MVREPPSGRNRARPIARARQRPTRARARQWERERIYASFEVAEALPVCSPIGFAGAHYCCTPPFVQTALAGVNVVLPPGSIGANVTASAYRQAFAVVSGTLPSRGERRRSPARRQSTG